jgi:signal transduction histidine kinase
MSRSSCGLGLVISKALCKELGGDILVSSILNQGSTFYFFIREEEGLETI